MSGGSYDYLCFKDSSEFLGYGPLSNLDLMVARLAGLGYARDAAEESERLLARCRAISVQLDVAIQRLSPIWKAVEWWDSCDSGEDSVKEALKEYRG